MCEVATILMKSGSGMTLTAVALASGLIAQGLSVCLIVPTMADAKRVPKVIPRNMVRAANDVTSMNRAMPHAYIFDDALRCADAFRRHGEGELLNIARNRLTFHQDRLTRIFLFQYTA